MMAASNYIRGLASAIWLSIAYQFKPFAQRVAARQPGLISVVVADVRSLTGRLLGRLLAIAGVE